MADEEPRTRIILQDLLPETFDHRIVEQNFVSSHEFSCELRVSAFTVEDAKNWLQGFGKKTLSRWIVKRTVRAERLTYKGIFNCCRSATNKQTAIQPTGSNTDCKAQITIKIKKVNRGTIKNDDYLKLPCPLPGMVSILFQHNHDVQCPTDISLIPRLSLSESAKAVIYPLQNSTAKPSFIPILPKSRDNKGAKLILSDSRRQDGSFVIILHDAPQTQSQSVTSGKFCDQNAAHSLADAEVTERKRRIVQKWQKIEELLADFKRETIDKGDPATEFGLDRMIEILSQSAASLRALTNFQSLAGDGDELDHEETSVVSPAKRVKLSSHPDLDYSHVGNEWSSSEKKMGSQKRYYVV